MLFPRALAVWCLILLLAIANGGLREAVLLPRLGLPLAQIVSGLLLIAVILLVSWLLVPRLGARSVADRWRVGLLWLLLTLGFEFGFGRLAQGRAWDELLSAYAFRDGNLWPLVLLLTLVAPVLMGRRRGRDWLR